MLLGDRDERRERGLDITPVFASFTRPYFYGQ
jgi:hypothetical protein